MAFECKFEDNSTTIKFTVQAAVDKALNEVGLQAVNYASLLSAVDTGRLKNSITYATSTYPGQGSYTDDDGNAFDDATAAFQPISGEVFVGTNVEYAPYVEEGTSRTKAQPFLKPAIENHISEYEQIFETHLKSAT